MKLNLDRESLLKPLQMVIGVVERKQTLPILSNVLVQIEGNMLSIAGTDLEVELIGQTNISYSAEANRLTVPGRKLIDICKALPEGAPVELYQEKERVVLSSGRSRFTLSTLPANDFPSVEKYESNIQFSLGQKHLRYLLQRTHFAMAQQDVRYYLNGMLFEIKESQLKTVATDGHRLALNVIDCSTAIDHRIQIIVPRKGVLELLRLLDDNDKEINLDIGNNHIRAASNEFIFTSKLIDGRFPDYERVVPKSSEKYIDIDRETLKNALSRTAILCNEKFRGVRFEIRKNLLRILANNPEQEIAEEEIIINYSSEDLDIGFNVNYLLDILNILQTENVQLIFSDSNSSMLIEEANNNTKSTFVVMPMRL